MVGALVEGVAGLGQSNLFADGYHGVHHVVDFVTPSGRTYTALRYRNVDTSHSRRVRFLHFFEDGIDPSTGKRNFVQDDGSGAGPEEPTVRDCDGLQLEPYEVFITTIYFGDQDASGGLSVGDTICHVFSGPTDTEKFELTNAPIVLKLIPRGTAAYPRNTLVKVLGHNFGPTQEPGDQVRIGKRWQYQYDVANPGTYGRTLRVRTWRDTRIWVRLRRLPSSWEGTWKRVWVVKENGESPVVSNYGLLKILSP